MGVETPGDAYRAFEHAAWERAATCYSDTFAALTRLFAKSLVDAVGCVQGLSLLDLACGPGIAAPIAAARGAAVTGVDFSAAMVAQARQRHPSLVFEQGDAETLPFGDQTFDRVVCGFGVHHFPDPIRALAEAHRVLRPGGRLAFSVWAAEGHAPTRLLVDSIRAHGTPGASLPTAPHGHINTGDTCLEILRQAGFAASQSSASTVRASLKVVSISEVITMMIKGTARSSALIRLQPPEAMPAILSEMERAAATYWAGDGYALPAAAILAVASRK